MEKTERKQIVKEEIERTDFEGSLNYKENSKANHFEAKTHLQTKEVQVTYNPEYEKKGKSPSEVLRDMPRHEMGHHGYEDLETRTQFYGCPRNVDNSRKLIYEPMFSVLHSQGFSQEDTKYLENALEDTLLHSDQSRQNNLQGIADFFEDVAQTNENGFGNLYEAHVKMNLWLWGNKQQKRQLGKYFKHSPEVKEVLENVLQRTGLKDITQELGDGDTAKDLNKARDFLMDEKNWPKISEIYAEEFSKLMQPGYALPSMNHSGAGTSGREDEDSTEEGNCFQEEAEGENYKRTRVTETQENGGNLPEWMADTQEHLVEARTLYYNNLARKLNIKAETQTHTHTISMPAVYFGSRPFDPLKDTFKRTKLKPNDKGQLEWKKNRFQIPTPIEVKETTRGFPPVRLGFLDCSTSMLSSPDGSSDKGNKKIVPWGDNSRYHYAVLGWEGFLEYLRQNRLLNKDAVELYTIGEKTRQGIGLKAARNLALNPTFESDTTIDPSVVKDIFRGKGNLIFTVSDGQIRNWDEVKQDIFEGAERNLYFHLQIGSDSGSAIEMRNRGIHATEPILNGEDIPRLTIDLTKQARNIK